MSDGLSQGFVMSFQEEVLPVTSATVATRAANEGIPIAAIARIVQLPYDTVVDHLRSQVDCGRVGEMPKADWPPGERWAARLPTVPRSAHPEDIEFQCKRTFKLTKLEAAFMIVLLRYDKVDKEKLHCVIEDQRSRRPLRPDKQESTDPKMVDVIVCKLRKKLKAVDPGYLLTTSWGDGYYFEAAIKIAIMQLLTGTYAQSS